MNRTHAIALVSFIGLGAVFVLTEYLSYVRAETTASTAVSLLLAISNAQAEFRKGEHYGPGRTVYANTHDGTGLADLHRLPDGRALDLIDASLAAAARGTKPVSGYYFASVPCENNEHHYSVCAVPASYGRPASSTFLLDTSGVVYRIDARELEPSLGRGERAQALSARPSDDELLTRGWVPVAQL